MITVTSIASILTAVLVYKDGSGALSPDGQIDVAITATDFEGSPYEVLGAGRGLASIADKKTKAFGNSFTK